MPLTARHRDLALTAAMLGLLLTPAWFLPAWISVPWQVALLLLGPPALWYSWSHAPWQPTPHAEVERVIAALDLAPGERFCDLGAGDGRLVLWVRRATGAHCTGLEASPLQWALARIRLALSGGEGVVVRLADLYATELRDFDALYVWGTAYSVTTERFGDHVRDSCRPGARLVSYHHPVHGLEPITVDRGGQRPLFVYELPG